MMGDLDNGAGEGNEMRTPTEIACSIPNARYRRPETAPNLKALIDERDRFKAACDDAERILFVFGGEHTEKIRWLVLDVLQKALGMRLMWPEEPERPVMKF